MVLNVTQWTKNAGVRTKVEIEGSTNKQLHKIGRQAMDLFSLDIHIKELKKKLQQEKEVFWL